MRAHRDVEVGTVSLAGIEQLTKRMNHLARRRGPTQSEGRRRSSRSKPCRNLFSKVKGSEGGGLPDVVTLSVNIKNEQILYGNNTR